MSAQVPVLLEDDQSSSSEADEDADEQGSDQEQSEDASMDKKVFLFLVFHSKRWRQDIDLLMLGLYSRKRRRLWSKLREKNEKLKSPNTWRRGRTRWPRWRRADDDVDDDEAASAVDKSLNVMFCSCSVIRRRTEAFRFEQLKLWV